MSLARGLVGTEATFDMVNQQNGFQYTVVVKRKIFDAKHVRDTAHHLPLLLTRMFPVTSFLCPASVRMPTYPLLQTG